MTTPASSARAVTMPDKPSIDGLEDKWAQVWAEQGTYAFDRAGAQPRGSLLDRHPAADGQRLAARRPRLLLHPHRLHRPLQADGGLRGLLPDRLGRQRPADRAPGAELLRRARRRRPCPTTAGFKPPRQGGDGKSIKAADQRADQPPELHRAVRRSSPSRTRRPSSRSSAGSGFASTGTSTTAPSTTARGRRAQQAFLRNLARGEAYQAEAPGPVGRHVPDRRRPGRARGPRLPRRTTTASPSTARPARPVLHRDDPARADPARAWRSSPTPTTSATQALFGTTVHLAAVRRRGARARPPGSPRWTRAPASRCAAPSATSPTCMWWRELQLPTRSVITRNGRLQAETPEWIAGEPGEQLYAELAGKTTFSAREAVVDGAARVRRPRRRADSRPSARRTSTRRATSRSRSSPRGSGTSATAAATRPSRAQLIERGARARLPPGVHAHPLRELGRAASTATG